MFKFLRKKRPSENLCMHDYKFLHQTEKEVEYGNGLHESVTVIDIFVYCPRCKDRLKVSPLEWNLIQKEQAIDNIHMKAYQVEPITEQMRHPQLWKGKLKEEKNRGN